MANKLANKGKQLEGAIEPPWKFLAGLDPQDAKMMRRVMVKIYLGFSQPTAPPDGNKFNYRVLSREQRLRVNDMMKEAHTDNPLLLSMLTWFANKYRAEDNSVLSAGMVIRDYVTNFVRQPNLYREEYKEAVTTWKEFLFENEGGGLSESEVKTMLLRADHKTIVKKVLAQRKKEEAGEVISEPSFACDSDDVPTEDERTEAETQLNKKKSKNVFTETELSGFKQTRSGRGFRSVMNEDDEFQKALEASRLEAEGLESRRKKRAKRIRALEEGKTAKKSVDALGSSIEDLAVEVEEAKKKL